MSSTRGTPTAVRTAFSVPFRPKVATNPTATMIDGSTNGRIVTERSVRRPGNSKRARTYAAGSPSATLRIVESTAW
jgi:hypothetical protein